MIISDGEKSQFCLQETYPDSQLPIGTLKLIIQWWGLVDSDDDGSGDNDDGGGYLGDIDNDCGGNDDVSRDNDDDNDHKDDGDHIDDVKHNDDRDHNDKRDHTSHLQVHLLHGYHLHVPECPHQQTDDDPVWATGGHNHRTPSTGPHTPRLWEIHREHKEGRTFKYVLIF